MYIRISTQYNWLINGDLIGSPNSVNHSVTLALLEQDSLNFRTANYMSSPSPATINLENISTCHSMNQPTNSVSEFLMIENE